jgi:hypothetical protein
MCSAFQNVGLRDRLAWESGTYSSSTNCPAPTGFVASAGTTQILFVTDAPAFRQGNGHARTRIYAANYSGTGPQPTFADAVEYTNFGGNIAAAPFDPASNLRLWAKWESRDGVLSPPAGGTNGIAATTDLVEDAMIANLNVAKLLAGALSVGQYIQSSDYVAGVSGFRLQSGSGGASFLEVRGNALFSGTIYAGAGAIGGITIGSNYLRSTNYVLGTTGFNFSDNGTGQIGGVTFTTTSVQSNNYVAGTSGFRFTAGGAIEGGDVTLFGGLIRNAADTARLDLSASGTSILLRSGASASFGFAGTHYPVEIRADGSGFFGRGIVSGGQVKASGTLSIAADDKPAIIFYTTPPAYSQVGGDGP